MTSASTRRLAAVGAVVLLLIFLVAPVALKDAPLPMLERVRIVETEIYTAIDDLRRIPREVAVPYLAQLSLPQFIKLLPLDDAVRSRISARIDQDDFVDQLVPFALMIKDIYQPQGEAPETFDAHLRKQYTEAEALPGFEHSTFTWQPASSEVATAPFTLDRAVLAARLLSLYDALYLREDAGNLGERLSCQGERSEADLERALQNALPVMRATLEEVRQAMPLDNEIGVLLSGLLEDEVRLETVTLSIAQFIDQMVCKHYRMFASRVTRHEQLQAWMLGELDQPAAGKLWQWLDHANHTRRYGVVVAVDGLQGSLVEALSGNKYDAAFTRAIFNEQQAGEARMQDERLAQQVQFLEAFAARGFDDPRYLPFFRDLYRRSGEQDALVPQGIARVGVSTTPTISVRNLPIIKTGAPVAAESGGATGIPNFHFVDRDFVHNGVQQGRAYYFFGNDALMLTELAQASGMQSLFQRLPDRGAYSCTAQYDEAAQAGVDPFLNLALGEAVRDFGEILCFAELAQRAKNEARLNTLREELLTLRPRLGREVSWFNWYQWWNTRATKTRARQLVEQIALLETSAMPELLVYYNPWPDHFAHFTGPFADEILAPSGELARLDYWLGKLTEIYKTAGVFERTLFGMSGDHGLSPVFSLHSPEALVLTPLIERGVPLRVTKISSDEGEGPKLTHRLDPPSMRGIDIVVASTAGGNYMLDLFVDQQERWAEQPLVADLRAWQPIAWQESSSSRTIDILDELLQGLGDTLEYMAVRAARSGVSGATISLLAPRGTAAIERRGERMLYRYEQYDLLGVTRLTRYRNLNQTQIQDHKRLLQQCMQVQPDNPDTWCTATEWRRLTAYTDKPGSVDQLAHLYDLDRAGTINLFPAEGMAYNSVVPGRHAGESFHEKDAFTGLWGTPVAGQQHGERLPVATGGSIPSSIFEYLNERPITPGQDGWGYPSLWHLHSGQEHVD